MLVFNWACAGASVRSCRVSAAICAKTIEVGKKMKEYVISPVIPERAHLGSETQFSADNQPQKRGRPRGRRNKMPRALKEAIVEVVEEVGRVPSKDLDKLLRGDDDGLRGCLKFLAIREPKVFLMLICRILPSPSRTSVRRRP